MNKKNIFLKIVGASSILSISFGLAILICILMLMDFFGGSITKEKVMSNALYADAYISASNKYLKDGYVPLQRILYFYLEDNSLSIDTLYLINQDKNNKTTKEISLVCNDERVKNLSACSSEKIEENKEFLLVSTKKFNIPLKENYVITSFFNEERIVYGVSNVHNGWDLAVPEKTPVFSVCNGVVTKVNYTQNENIPYDQSKNRSGNSITIKCSGDYQESYNIIFHHLYPNSSKVRVGDTVNHWTEIASVGTTGYSNGNHLHYQVQRDNGELLDGMQFINLLNNR